MNNVEIKVKVNGKDRTETVPARLLLSDFIRQNLGEEAFNEATYYANQADRPGAIPDQTRENMLALAEAIVSRARLTPIQQPGALGSNVGAAPEALDAPQGVPAIGLDTTPTGTMRVDAAGNAAPEVRAARRSAELTTEDAAAVAAALHKRDASDSQVVDFLTAAPVVTVVDSTDLDFAQTVDAVLDVVRSGTEGSR